MKKSARALVLGALVLSLLAGCGGKKAEKVQIRFATWDSEETLTLQQAIVDKFKAANPDVDVVLEGYGDDFDTKIAAGIGAGDAPDVMYMWNFAHYKGGLEELEPWIGKEKPEFKKDFYDTLFNYTSIGGKALGLPIGYTTHVVYYNKALFDKAGVPYPQGDWTWDQLLDTARKVANPKEKVYGFAFQGGPDPYDFEHYLWNAGAAYLGPDGKLKGGLDDPKAVALLEKMQKAIKDGYAISSEGSGSKELRSGKLAMFVNGSWSIPSMKKDGIAFGLAKMPSVEPGAKSVSVVSVSGVSMYNKSKHKDAAWRFMKFWTSAEANKLRIDYEMPVLRSVAEGEKLTSDPIVSVFYQMLEQSGGRTPTSYKVESWSEMSETISEALQRVFNPTVLEAPSKALSAAAAK
ncbi:MAG: sugar ABC transporter substrate-binding protein [Spirochaetaceae bacterium]|nr:sugar ABC transporter substrate-binding protein [Spirochaetaceae bacterium]